MICRCKAALLALVLAGLWAAPAIAESSPVACSPQPARGTPVSVRAPSATLLLRVADDSQSRSYGLMCVTALAPQTGMVFLFRGGDYERDFWMKNTLIPLDMIWVTADGRVTTVAAHVPATTVDTPDAQIPHRSGKGSYVIELAAGEAARDGIKPGVRLDLAKVGLAKD
jgi:uncharacterized membrane protein (UPF0127 family)